MSEFEDLLHRSLGERAASVRTAPDEGDLRRRIHRSQRVTARRQRRAMVAALVVVAGSAGGVAGAVATRPNGVTTQRVDAPLSTSGPHSAHGGPGPGHVASTTSSSVPLAAPSVVHRATLDGVTVEWLVSSLAQAVEVVPGSGGAPTCSKVAVVSLTIAAGTPVAGDSGVVGLPAVRPEGLAVVSSGSFGSPGTPGTAGATPSAAGGSSGWWAIVEAGSAASDVAVQFPSGAVVRAPLSADGVAVVASLAPAGVSASSLPQYASAVAEGGTRALGSLEFLLGGGLAVVDAADAPAGAAAMASCPLAAAVAASPGVGALGTGSGPPAPLVAAGDVVAAYSQAYDIDPLLGLTWNFSAVDLGSTLGCPVETLPGTTGSRSDGLAAPAVAVEAVAFTSPVEAIVVYQRGSGLLETGTASLAGGAWKVGRATYCADMQSSAG